MQGWYYVESLTGQRHDRVQSESQIATMDSCFDLVGSLQHGVASCEVFSWSTDIHKTHYMQMVMTSDETQIQIFANWPMSHAKRVTRDKRKNSEYRVAAAIRKLRTDTNCPAGESWPNHVKNERLLWPKNEFHANWFSLQFEITKLIATSLLGEIMVPACFALRPCVFHWDPVFFTGPRVFLQTPCFLHPENLAPRFTT